MLLEWWSCTECTLFTDQATVDHFGKEHVVVILNHNFEIDFLCGWTMCERFGVLGVSNGVREGLGERGPRRRRGIRGPKTLEACSREVWLGPFSLSSIVDGDGGQGVSSHVASSVVSCSGDSFLGLHFLSLPFTVQRIPLKAN